MGDYTRPQDEDCLTLTIATPAADGHGRPVVVWLHGGAYLSGAGSLDWYDGSMLASDGDLVFVGVNYRLGALGFLHHPAVGNGDYAMLDMIAALEWVRDNIEAFGGDPARVTVMGQSAGAHAIMCLLARPKARTLFRRAVLQSAPPSLATLTTVRATGHAERLLDALDVPRDAPDIAERLRAETPGRLVAAQMAVARQIAEFADVAPPFVPVSDALSDPHDFIAAAAKGAGEAGVDVVIGTTREEMHAFFAADPSMADPDPALVAAQFSRLAGRAEAIEDYRNRRPGASLVDLISDLVTDFMFLYPSLAFADSITRTGSKAWAYAFDCAAPRNGFRACHCIELPFTFGTFPAWGDAPMLAGGDRREMAMLSATMRAAWAAFAHDGDPSTGALPWPPYRAPDRRTMVFGSVTGVAGDPAGVAWREGYERWRIAL
jgi:para-nitrobenzyl esterase